MHIDPYKDRSMNIDEVRKKKERKKERKSSSMHNQLASPSQPAIEREEGGKKVCLSFLSVHARTHTSTYMQ